MFERPRALIYDGLLEFNDKRYKMIKEGYFSVNEDRLYSGENDFQFRFKVCQITNLSSIFTHFDHECYYNGYEAPSFVSFYPGKKNLNTSRKRICE